MSATYSQNNTIYHGQNLEDRFVSEYFGTHIGRLLDIGANDGTTLSNSKALIDAGWAGILCEPSTVYKDLAKLHEGNLKVECLNVGVGSKRELVDFWQSGAHVPNGTDKALVSTTNFEETKRWPEVSFERRTVQLIPFSDLGIHAPFDFISIDTEGQEWEILQQIDLEAVGCRCLCIEWNGNHDLFNKFEGYCDGYGLGIKLVNHENLIFCK